MDNKILVKYREAGKECYGEVVKIDQVAVPQQSIGGVSLSFVGIATVVNKETGKFCTIKLEDLTRINNIIG